MLTPQSCENRKKVKLEIKENHRSSLQLQCKRTKRNSSHRVIWGLMDGCWDAEENHLVFSLNLENVRCYQKFLKLNNKFDPNQTSPRTEFLRWTNPLSVPGGPPVHRQVIRTVRLEAALTRHLCCNTVWCLGQWASFMKYTAKVSLYKVKRAEKIVRWERLNCPTIMGTADQNRWTCPTAEASVLFALWRAQTQKSNGKKR